MRFFLSLCLCLLSLSSLDFIALSFNRSLLASMDCFVCFLVSSRLSLHKKHRTSKMAGKRDARVRTSKLSKNVTETDVRYTVNSRLADTSLLRTKEKSHAETIKKYMKTTLATTDARYYGHTDTSPGPKLKFSLFFSRYNGHFRHVFKNWCHLNPCIWQNNIKLALC